jgi:hypothetical protein
VLFLLPAEPQLSPAEEEAEQLMRQAAVAWNVQHNKELAEKFQRKAMEAVTAKVGFCQDLKPKF